MDVTFSNALLSLGAGGLTTLSPCVFPLLPLVLGGALQGHRLAPVAMGAGMATTFALMGVLLGVMSEAIGLDPELVRKTGAVLLIAMALFLLVPSLGDRLSHALIPLASSANLAASKTTGGSLLSAFGLGATLGLVWSPCSGPLLASAMTLAASEGNAVKGGVVLGLFGLGAATPLVLVAYASRAAVQRAKEWLMRRIEKIKLSFALLLGAMGAAILLGFDKWIEARIVELLPESWIRLTVGI